MTSSGNLFGIVDLSLRESYIRLGLTSFQD